MNINLLGALANVTSLILWIPQARTTWKNRNSYESLKGISVGTQWIVIINTLLWCAYGWMIDNWWVSMGTIIILPLACMTLFFKRKVRKTISTTQPRRWFTFQAYKQLSDADKKYCLYLKYTTEFEKQISLELLNFQSYELMPDLDKMYWDKELWKQKYSKKIDFLLEKTGVSSDFLKDLSPLDSCYY